MTSANARVGAVRPRRRFLALLVLLAAATVARTGVSLHAQIVAMRHANGQNVTPVFEGWYRNADGTVTISFGYLNRNYEEQLDIPVGPNNRIDPQPLDQGQPTHFLPRRQFGIFTVVVPKDFGDRTITWTLTANGGTASIAASLKPMWEIGALKDSTAGNTPPVVRFDPNGPSGQGPRGVSSAMSAPAHAGLPLSVWVTDDGVVSLQQAGRGPRLKLTWSHFRGAGQVVFDDARPSVGADGKALTTATFSTPGEYVLRLLANDYSGDGGGGTQCCWTNGYVKVTVAPQRSEP